jgi:uncharacterized damage-inducible protein DinB
VLIDKERPALKRAAFCVSAAPALWSQTWTAGLQWLWDRPFGRLRFRRELDRQANMTDAKQPEPWLRGTLTDVRAVPRAVLHALELAEEDLIKWCGALSQEQLNTRPPGLASVAFHIRNIARSIERLLTYAERQQLDEAQMAALRSEMDVDAAMDAVFRELNAAINKAGKRIRALASGNLEAARLVGRKELPTTLGGLLVHIADHTQRHVGQAIVTVKVVRSRQQAGTLD